MAVRLSDKRPVRGIKYVRRGKAKKHGGVGRKIVGKTPRWFRPNLQRIKVVEPDGRVHRVWVDAKQLKSSLITKAPKQKLMAQLRAEIAEAKKR
jgi:large subunit ribosomal protein L28